MNDEADRGFCRNSGGFLIPVSLGTVLVCVELPDFLRGFIRSRRRRRLIAIPIGPVCVAAVSSPFALICLSSLGLVSLLSILLCLLLVFAHLFRLVLCKVDLLALLPDLVVHLPQPLVLAPPGGLVDVELAGAGAGAGALDVCDDFGGRRALAAGDQGGRGDANLLVGLREESVDGGGLGGDGGEGALLGRALGARVGGGGD